jgi:hypothetical protein
VALGDFASTSDNDVGVKVVINAAPFEEKKKDIYRDKFKFEMRQGVCIKE